ncbi:MAG: hypothetical protein ACP5E5_14060 [Acidobacteriaceae bacterium]
MKLRFLVPALALALTTIAAHAQFGVYVNPVVSLISNSTPDTGEFAFLGDNETSQIFGGVVFGGYDEFAHYSKASVGVDLRDTFQHGNNASINSFMAGVIVAAKPMALFKLKPYGQFSVGAGRTKAALSPAHIERLQFAGYGGVDRPLNQHIDWRIAEISYGALSTISSETFKFNSPNFPDAHVLGFSTGFVFRFK